MINIKPTEFQITLDINGSKSMYSMIEDSIEKTAQGIKASDYDVKSIEKLLDERFYLLKQLDFFLNIGAYEGILNAAQKEFERKK